MFFFQAEDGIRDLVRSRGLGDVYKRQHLMWKPVSSDHKTPKPPIEGANSDGHPSQENRQILKNIQFIPCLLYTSDAADERSSVDLGGRRIIKKKK